MFTLPLYKHHFCMHRCKVIIMIAHYFMYITCTDTIISNKTDTIISNKCDVIIIAIDSKPVS